MCPFLEQIVHCVHTNLETHSVLYTKLHVIIVDVSHCLTSVFVLISNQCAQRLTRACHSSLSLMQFNVVSFALDSQLPLPWRRAYKTSCSSLLLPHYNHVWSFFFPPSLFPLSLFICLSFLKEPWVRDKQTVAPSKDVLPCKQLPLQDKLLLFALQGALISVHQKPEGLAHTRNFSGRHDK